MAGLNNRYVVLTIDIELSGVAPGEYLLGFRRPEFSWRYHLIDVDE